jgi:hypothetical protein
MFSKIVILDVIHVLVQAGQHNVLLVEMVIYYGINLYGNHIIHADNIVQRHLINLMEIHLLDNIILVLVVYVKIAQQDVHGVEIVQILINATCVVMVII